MDIKTKIQQATADIQQQYLADDMPWVIGYSGGKDSTATLQLVMYALMRLPKEQLTKEVHVLTNDTLVENPAVVSYVDTQLKLIERMGKTKLFTNLPNHFQVAKVVPKIEDRFWINLIGKGYPAPNRWFRWCTDRLKITPTNDYIKQTVSRHGKALVVLGTRRAESTNRAKSMDKYDLSDITGDGRTKHTLPNSWRYSPIADWTTNEVWQYLMQVPNAWGGDNKKLITMYRNASENSTDCPLVIDTSTSSCGNSRFGCWVCTVVSRDKSMENLIENGEEWMLPMLEFRDYLMENRDDPDARMIINRQGKITDNHNGPFKFEVRAKMLEKVLQIENETGLDLISHQELVTIQQQWHYDGGFDHSVAEIYFNLKNKHIMIPNTLREKREKEEISLLKEAAAQYGVNHNHILALLSEEREQLVYIRRKDIHVEIRNKINRFVVENSLEEKEKEPIKTESEF